MWCFIHRWEISRAIDSGKPPAALTRRHLEKCASCRDFSRLSEEIGKRLAADASALIGSADASPAGRVRPALPATASTASVSPAPGRLK
ncbi:MAG: hypothetical protein WBC70_04715, partial [Candidatus Aminicenantales bacterium]